MKILVGNHAFNAPGGSETYAYALIAELVKLGHEVEGICIGTTGLVSSEINKLGVPVHFSPENFDRTFDLVLASHSTSINLMKKVKGYKVQTCHGVFPKLEQPVPGMNQYVAISEEVQNHLTRKGYKSKIIKNGVDCERYAPKIQLNKKLKTVLSLAHGEAANVIIQEACDKFGCTLIKHNKFKMWSWDMENTINQSDLVISLGRGAYESMATGRNVVIFDKRRYVHKPALGDGIITKDNVELYLKNNCSGRYSKKEFNADKLVEEFKKYNPQHGKDLREYALKNLNIKEQAQKYLALLNG